MAASSRLATVNTPPSCAWLSPEDGLTIYEGEPIAFEANVSDAEFENAELSVRVESDLDEVFLLVLSAEEIAELVPVALVGFALVDPLERGVAGVADEGSALLLSSLRGGRGGVAEADRAVLGGRRELALELGEVVAEEVAEVVADDAAAVGDPVGLLLELLQADRELEEAARRGDRAAP